MKKGQYIEEKGLFYSDYAGIVANNEDPEKVFRLQVKVPAIFQDQILEAWALPKGVPSGKRRGFTVLPKVGENVWVSFMNGDLRFPLWQYGAFSIQSKPGGIDSDKVMIWQSSNGLFVKLDEESETIEIQQTNGFAIKVGEKIEISGGGVSLKTLIDTLLDELIALQVLTPSGTGKTSPDSVIKLQQLKLEYDKLLK